MQFINEAINATKTNNCLKCTKFRMQPICERKIYGQQPSVLVIIVQANVQIPFQISFRPYSIWQKYTLYIGQIYVWQVYCQPIYAALSPAVWLYIDFLVIIICRGGKIEHLWIVEMKCFENNTQHQLIHIKHSTYFKGLRFFSC